MGLSPVRESGTHGSLPAGLRIWPLGWWLLPVFILDVRREPGRQMDKVFNFDIEGFSTPPPYGTEVAVVINYETPRSSRLKFRTIRSSQST